MKFSYKLLKQLVPSLPKPKQLADLLTMHLFETEAVDKDTLEVQVLPNRYSDAASHWGLAREIKAIANIGKSDFEQKSDFRNFRKLKVEVEKNFEILIKTKLCYRMAARYFEGVEIKPSPKWMQDILKTCGVRSINNIVDITNYVTLETGQPLHAFDFDKMTGDALIARSARKSEEVESLEGKKYKLAPDNLVLADKKDALDIAGIKGGKKAEITSKTISILLTAGNFDSVSVYKTSRKIGLMTDASVRFSHNISPELVSAGIDRATELIQELCGGKVGTLIDVYRKKPLKHPVKFDIKKFNKISGINLKEKEALGYLKRLGPLPGIRTDIERFEDLVEEIMRLYGYDKLSAKPPLITLRPSGYEDEIVFKDNVRRFLVGLGLDEVYNYSFAPSGGLELENPVSSSYSRLRSSLLTNLLKNAQDNLRFYDKVAIFEVGNVFDPERLSLGIVIADKKSSAVRELKGIVDQLFQQLGLVDYFTSEETHERLRIESDHRVIGFITYQDAGRTGMAEIDLEKLRQLVEEEKSFEPLPKFPSIMRDLSFLVPQDVRFGQIMALIENTAPRYLEDVDLIDFYEDPKFSGGRRSLTVRLVFLAKDRTLTDKEVDKEMQKIASVLIDKIDAEVR